MESRIEIFKIREDHYKVMIICEKTKIMIPVVGIDKRGAINLSQLLTDLAKNNMELPKTYEFKD